MFTSELFDDIPPPENARKTQIAGTLPTYKKAADMLAKTGVKGKALDFGAGLGHGTAELGPDADSYEPYPGEKFKPHFIDVTQIPDNSYHKIVNLNVLNVVPNAGEQRIRDSIVKNIGRVLAPGGVAIITTRGKDVLTIKGTPGEEPMSMISKIGTYQKGFTSAELRGYITGILGDGFEVSNVKLGPAGVMIKKLGKQGMAEDDHTDEENGMAQDNLNKMSKASQQINNKVKKLGGNKSLEPWQQQLVATAADKVDAVHHSMDDEMEEGIDGRGERHEPELNPGDSIMLTTVKGRTYTGTLSHINDDSIVFKTLGQGGNPHAPDDMESRSHVVALKMSHVANIEPLSMTENEQDWGEYEDGDEEQQDEGFFVAIGSEDDGAFVGMITKDGGKWRETEITGNAPYGWGGSYMSYLSSEDVMQHLRNDYGRHAQVKGPFSTEEAAMQYAQSHFDLGSDSEFGDEDYDTLEEQKLQIGDPIVVTYASEYEGEHGEIIDFSPSGSFVIVRMQNGDEASMHLSDVEYSEYEDEEDDEDGIQYWPPKRRPHRDDLDETVNDPDFERMMGKMTSPDSLKTREAVAMMMDLVYHNGASYKEALQQASSSFEIDPAKLQALYQQQLKQQGNPVDEAKGLRKRVRVVKGPAAGKTGWIREVKHGLYKGAPKRFYVDLDDGGHADNLPADALRLVKDLGEAGNPAQQAAIAIAMKKAGKKPKSESMQSAAHKPTGPSFADGKWKGTDSAAQAKNKYVGSGATESIQHDKQVLEYTINNMKRDGYEFFNEDDNGFDKCWTGYRKVGLKKKGDKMVNDCRPVKKKK